jgi:asparagine synthase (glutamine-hydrolysing)
MKGKLPNSIINRSKTGFAMPIRGWMKNSEMVNHYLNYNRINEQGVFHPAEVQRLIKLNNEGRIDASNLIFSMVLQQIWLEKGKY